MSEVLLTYDTAPQEMSGIVAVEPVLDQVQAEAQSFSDTEANDVDTLQQDETIQQSEEQVYNIAHGDGEKYSGTLEDAMKCPALRDKPREVAQRLIQKQVVVDRVLQKAREKKLADAAEGSKADVIGQNNQKRDQEQAKSHRDEGRQGVEAPVRSRAEPKERPESISAVGGSKTEELTVSDLPHRSASGSVAYVEREPKMSPKVEAHEDETRILDTTGKDLALNLSEAHAEVSARQPTAPLVRTYGNNGPIREVYSHRDAVRIADHINAGVRGPTLVKLPKDGLAEGAMPKQLHIFETADSTDLVAEDFARFGRLPEVVEDETMAYSADELRQLFGIGLESDSERVVDVSTQKTADRVEQLSTDEATGIGAGHEAADIVTTANDPAELLRLLGVTTERDADAGIDLDSVGRVTPRRAMETRRAFRAAGHAGGAALEDLVALDVELDDELAALRVGGADNQLSEGVLHAALAVETSDGLEVNEDDVAIMLPEVHPESLGIDTESESEEGSVDARTPIGIVGALPDTLQSLEPDQITAVEEFLDRVVKAVGRLDRVAELGEDDRAAMEQNLEAWCSNLFDNLGIDSNSELTRKFVKCIVSPEALTIAQGEVLSPLDIALLNYLGTNEYKGDQQASLLKGILNTIRDWLQNQQWLGHYVLKLMPNVSLIESATLLVPV